MNTIQVTAVLCEDIREEKGETVSVIGALPDVISFPMFPMVFPKLGFFIRISIPIEMEPKTIEVKLKGADGSIVEMSTFDPKTLSDSREKAKKNEMPFIGLLTRGVASPYQFNSPGLMEVWVHVDGTPYLAGALRVQKGGAITGFAGLNTQK